MTSKRMSTSDPVSAGGGSAARRPRRAGTTHKPAVSVESASEPINVDEQAIARLAYSYWESRGGVGGSPEEDWFRAERELLSHQ